MTAFTASITSALSSDNPFDVIKTTAIAAGATFLTVVVPQFVSGIATIGLAAAASTAGISLLIGVLVTAGAILVGLGVQYLANLKSENEKWVDQAKKIKDAEDAARSLASEQKQAAQESQKQVESAEQLKERFTELNEKSVLTNSEQEEYNELVDEIRKNLPEIITYYNEITGELRVQESLWESILDKQRKQVEIDTRVAFSTAAAASSLNKTVDYNAQISEIADITGIGENLLANLTERINKYQENPFYETDYILKDVNDWEKLAGVLGVEYKGIESLGNSNLGQGYTGLDHYINASYELQREFLSQLVDNTSNLNEFLKQYDNSLSDIISNGAIEAGKTAAESYASIKGEELSTGEQLIREYYGSKTGAAQKNIEILLGITTLENGTTDLGDGITLTDALGGDSAGPSSDNAFETWSKINQKSARDREIGGKQADILKEFYGTDKITTGQLVDTWKKIYGAQAAEVWAELNSDEAGQIQIIETLFGYLQNQKINEQVDKAIAFANEDFYDELNNKLTQAYESGVTKEELDALITYLSQKANVSKEDAKSIIADIQQTYDEAWESFKAYGFDKLFPDSLSSDQMSSLTSFADSIEDELGKGSDVSGIMTSFVNAAKEIGLETDDIITAISAFDWTKLDISNMVELQDNFSETMKAALEDSFNQEEVDTLWRNFFAASEEFNLINVRITSEGSLDVLEDTINEKITGIYEAYSGVSSYISEQVEKGFIDPLNKSKITEKIQDMGLNADDYFSTDSRGNIVFLYEKLAKDSKDLIQNKDVIIQQTKQEIEAGIEELEQQQQTLLYLANQIDGQNEFTNAIYDSAKAEAILQSYMRGDYDESKKISENIEKLKNDTKNSGSIAQELRDQAENYQIEIDKLNERLKNLDTEFTDRIALMNAHNRATDEAIAKGQEAAESAKEDADKYTDALKKVEDAQKKVADAQKKLNEALYGEEYYNDKLDAMYNYTTALEQVQRELDKTKEKFNDFAVENIEEETANYADALKKQTSIYLAERKIWEQSNQEYLKQLATGIPEELKNLNELDENHGITTDISGFYYTDSITGMLALDYDAINNSKIPDEMKDLIEETVKSYNDGIKKIQSIDDTLEKQEKEIDDYKKKILNEYVKIEDEVINILKEKYKEEVDANKEKNEAMAEADSEYLDALEDAINKQRELRERQNAWEDLVQKEKKASLIARDTSGANQVELNELNKEIEEDRQKLLDDTVDSILDNLKEMYDLQKEQREEQITLLEEQLDEEAIIHEAVATISGWNSTEDIAAWMIENNEDLANISDAKFEQKMSEWEDYYNKVNLFENFDRSALSEAIEADSSMINQVLLETSQDQINAASEAAGSAAEKTAQNIESAKETLKDAIDNLNDAVNELAKIEQKKLEEEYNNQHNYDDNYNNINNVDRSGYKNIVANRSEEISKGISLNDLNDNYKNNIQERANEISKNVSKNFLDKISYSPSQNKFYDYDTQTKKQTELSNVDLSLLLKRDPEKIFKALTEANGDSYVKAGKYYADNNMDYSSPINNLSDGSRFRVLLNQKDKEYLYFKTDATAKTLKELGYEVETLNKFMVGLVPFPTYAPSWNKYASGGLVNYTGPAWVDGTPQKPESFLSSEDTKRIGNAAKLLAALPALNYEPSSNSFSQIVGDTTIEVNINIESISDELDLENALDRMKKEIIDAAKPQGSSVILRK